LRILPARVHGTLDYLAGALLIALPWLGAHAGPGSGASGRGARAAGTGASRAAQRADTRRPTAVQSTGGCGLAAPTSDGVGSRTPQGRGAACSGQPARRRVSVSARMRHPASVFTSWNASTPQWLKAGPV
jgi:hypothetical protein